MSTPAIDDPGPTPSATSGSYTALSLLAATAILLVAAALRTAGLNHDLWIDEIWSLGIAGEMHSAWNVFTLHHEVNHHLNTLWLYWLGPGRPPLLVHLPSFGAGITSVAVAGAIGRRRSIATGLIAMVLVGCSYELTMFSSEARGYSLLVLCSLLAYSCLEAYLERPRWTAGTGYAMAAIAGMLAQPIFAAFLASACVWSAYRLWRTETDRRRAVMLWFACQSVPLVAFAALYFVDLRYVVPGGGTSGASLIDVYFGSLGWALGSPQSPVTRLVICMLAVAVVSAGLRELARSGSDSWVFFAGVIIVFPIVLIAVRGSDLVYTRHFLEGTTFLLILLSGLLGDWWARRPATRIITVAVLVAYSAVNLRHMVELAEYGRGEYQEAIHYMADHTAGALTIGGDQDFRVGTVLRYYMPGILGAGRGRYLEQGTWPAGGPAWLIVQAESFTPPTPPFPDITDKAGDSFDFVQTYRTAPLSGQHWFLYRNRVHQ